MGYLPQKAVQIESVRFRLAHLLNTRLNLAENRHAGADPQSIGAKLHYAISNR
jgi:hypothetical protein